MIRSSVRRQALLLCLAALVSILFSGAAPTATASPEAEQAAAVDAAINAIRRVTLKSADAIAAARAAYDALSPEAQALVKKLKTLETAERTLQTLQDQDAAARIKKLSDAGDHDGALQLAEEYIGDRALTDLRGNVVKNCLLVCVRKANAMMRADDYENAQAWLLECQRRYASVDISELNRAMAALERAMAEPESGTVLLNQARGEYGTVIVHAGDSPALVKLTGIGDTSRCVAFYVRAGETATIHIRDGNYRMRYAVGEKWYGLGSLFGSTTRCYSVDTLLRFSTDRVANDIYSQRYEITLHAPSDGALSAEVLPREDF